MGVEELQDIDDVLEFVANRIDASGHGAAAFLGEVLVDRMKNVTGLEQTIAMLAIAGLGAVRESTPTRKRDGNGQQDTV